MAKEKGEKGRSPKPKGDHREAGRARVIIRVLGTDVDGEKGVAQAILKIKGVSYSFANAVCKAAKIDPKKKVGSFSESEIDELEEVIKDPIKHGVPVWIVNRRRDIESGTDVHMSSSDIIVTKKFDVQRMIDKKTYKGTRHMLGLPVRGQRTRSSFRKGRTVGVVRKSARIAQTGSGKKKDK
jgi:small subunit ribosomal protein S13